MPGCVIRTAGNVVFSLPMPRTALRILVGTLLSEGLAWHHQFWELDKKKQALMFFGDTSYHVPCNFSTSSYTWTLDMEIEPW